MKLKDLGYKETPRIDESVEGMYVRTKDGIKYVYEMYDDEEKRKYVYKIKQQDGTYDLGVLCDDDIIGKPSYYPIDLIEVGDYVNGYKVIGFDETYFNGTDRIKEPKRIEIIIDNIKFEFENHIKKEDIKTILTKEQFENNCYKIGD